MSTFWLNRRVLITGMCGFLGAWLARLLVEQGARVTGFDAATGEARFRCLDVHEDVLDDAVLNGSACLLGGSVLERGALATAFREIDPEVVVHLAGQSMIEGAAASPYAAYELNVLGTLNVLEACRNRPAIRAVLCASSNHVYGSQVLWPFTEGQPLNQLDVYGASKACADILVRSYAKVSGVPAVAVRNVNSYGPADPHASHIVTGSILSVLRGERPVVRSDGSPRKAYLHARDTMRAYMMLAERAGESGVRGEAFNVTAGQPISALELARAVCRAADRPDLEPEVRATDLSQAGYFEHLSDFKIRTRTPWRAETPLDAGLRETVDWYRKRDGWGLR